MTNFLQIFVIFFLTPLIEGNRCQYNDVLECAKNLGNYSIEVEGHHPVVLLNSIEELDEICEQSFQGYKLCLNDRTQIVDAHETCVSAVKLAESIALVLEKLCSSSSTQRNDAVNHLNCVHTRSDYDETCRSILTTQNSVIIEKELPDGPTPWSEGNYTQCIILKEYMYCIEETVEVSCGRDTREWMIQFTQISLRPFKYFITCDIYGPTGGHKGVSVGILVAIVFAVVLLTLIWYTQRVARRDRRISTFTPSRNALHL